MYCNNPIEHTVQAGDTLYKLSRQYQTTVAAIILGNPNINPYNLQIGMKVKICSDAADYTPGTPDRDGNLKERMRLAWIDHVYWTRLFLNSVAADAQDQQETAAELISKVDGIVNQFARFYPQNVVMELKKLLIEHVELVGAVITGMKSERKDDRERLQKELYENADRIASLLANETPEFNEQEIKDMLYQHLDLTGQEIMQRFAGKYDEDIATFEKIEQQAVMMADYFTKGLEKEAAASGL